MGFNSGFKGLRVTAIYTLVWMFVVSGRYLLMILCVVQDYDDIEFTARKD